MANKGEGGTKRSLPPEQEREKENDGRIKRFLCDVLRLRVLGYIVAQPAAFTFILSLFLLAVCMPAIGRHIISAHQLPDLFAMRIWNAYLGNLQSQEFCIVSDTSADVNPPTEAVDVVMDFLVERDVCEAYFTDDKNQGKKSALLISQLTGLSLKTKIKDTVSGQRVDGNVTVYISLKLDDIHGDQCGHRCAVNACVSISAPPNAAPARMPHIPEDFTFQTKMLNSDRKPPGQCPNVSEVISEVKILKLSHEACKGLKRTVRPADEKYRHHGLINIYLEDSDKKVASSHLQLAAVAVAALAVAFIIGVACTDRPHKPKPSTE